MAVPQAHTSRADTISRRAGPLGRRSLESRTGTILLTLVALGLVGGQISWPNEVSDRTPNPPAGSGRDAYGDTVSEAAETSESYADNGASSRNPSEARALDLAARGARLKTRALMIASLVAQENVGQATSICRPPGPSGTDRFALAATSAPAAGLVTDRSADVSPAGLRLSDSADRPLTGEPDLPTPDLEVVAARIGVIEAAQLATVRCLSEAVTARIALVRSALLATGLSPRTSTAAIDVGGPYVPVTMDALDTDIDRAAAFLRAARGEASRLDEAAENVPLGRPMRGQIEVTSTFGVRIDPFYGRPALHTGIDLMGAYGSSVEATAAGTVTMAGPSGGYGNMVEIDHGRGLVTRYAHLSTVAVIPNQSIAAGDVIGHVGASGRATGPHLHYETRIDGEPVDPARFLKAGAMLAASDPQRARPQP